MGGCGLTGWNYDQRLLFFVPSLLAVAVHMAALGGGSMASDFVDYVHTRLDTMFWARRLSSVQLVICGQGL